MIPVFHPAAEQELAAAMKIGDERGLGLGAELLCEVRWIVALLCESPNIGEPLDEHRRRFRLRRFPFGPLSRATVDTRRQDGKLLALEFGSKRGYRFPLWQRELVEERGMRTASSTR